MAVCLAVACAARTAAVELRSKSLAGLRTEVAALIMQGVEGGALPMAVAAFAEDAAPVEGSERFSVPLVFELPGAVLLAGASAAEGAQDEDSPEQGAELRLELYAYALDARGAVVAHRAELVEIDLATSGELLFATGLRFRDTIELPEGRYSLRLLALAPATRRYALALEEVTLERQSEEPALMPPRFDGSCDSWLEVRSRSAQLLPPSNRAARSVLRAGERVSASAALLGVEVGVAKDQPVLEMKLRPVGEEAVVEGVELAVGAASAQRMGARVEFEVSLPDLPMGRYEATLEWGAGENRWSSRPLETWVLDSGTLLGDSLCAPAWSEVFRVAASEAGLATETRDTGEQRARWPLRRGAAERELRARYLEVLRGLTTGGTLAEAAQRLGDVENDYLSNDNDTFGNLGAIEYETARELAAADDRSLAVLLMLHKEAYSEHFRKARFGLATHSREIVVEMVEGLTDRTAGEAGQVLTAGILVSLADEAERHQVSAASQRLLGRALDLDPNNQEAQILLATSYERLGRFALARPHLEAVVARNAQNVEARLRLAVILARKGEFEKSERLTRHLLGERIDGWRRAIAYQTLARALFSREFFDQAVAALAEGCATVPGDQRLALLYAYALDRAGRPGEAAVVLRDLPAGHLEGSPRLRYGQPLDTVLEPLKQLLEQSISLRLPLLAQAIEQTERGERGP